MLSRIHHIGIAVRNLDEAAENYAGALGAQIQGIHEVASSQTRLAFLSAGNTMLELLQPAGPDSGIARFLESHGEGIHHICFEVDDISKSLEFLSARGIPLRDKKPRQSEILGKIAFIQPEAMNGVTIELAEIPREKRAGNKAE